VAEQTGGRDGLRKDNADRNKDSYCAWCKGDRDLHARTFWIFVAAAESDSALGKILADRDFFLEAAAPDTGQDTGFDSVAVAARQHAIFFICARGWRWRGCSLGLRFDPDRRSVAEFADTCDTFPRFKRSQLQFIEVNDFAALAQAAFHQKPGERFFGFVRGGEFDFPKIVVRFQ